MTLLSGERQVAPTDEGIRRDHVARYEWAAERLSGSVLDVGCGVGYGSWLLAEAGMSVLAIDRDAESLEYARTHYAHAKVVHWERDVTQYVQKCGDKKFAAAVAFEIIEHLEDPLPLLSALSRMAPRLLASVPNEEVFPYRGYKFHFRHYTPAQFRELLEASGWRVTGWYGQSGPDSDVEERCRGRTLVVEAVRADKPDLRIVADDPTPALEEAPAVPEHVAILGLGPSLAGYMDLARRCGGRRSVADETWAINALGDVFACDRIFHMDDVRVQERRATAQPQSNIANMLKWLKTHPGPIYTSVAHPDYPGTQAYPLESVVNSLGFGYFNSTAAYAVAYAVYLGVKRISLYGCDYTYANAHQAEQGRGCLEFWLGFAAARGIKLRLPPTTSLMDACEPSDRRYYGYDLVELHREGTPGNLRFTLRERPEALWPTADEIEARYDHSAHPNPLVSQD